MADLTPLVSVSFALLGRNVDLGPVAVRLKELGGRVWTQRHVHLKGRPDLHNTAWIVETLNEPNRGIDDVILVLLRRVWAHKEAVRRTCHELSLSPVLECRVKIRGDLYADRPEYELSPEVMRMLSELDCPFALDIYWNQPDEP